MIIDTPEGIELYRLLQLKYAMKLELETGMKHSRLGSVIAKVKKHYGYTGSKRAVYERFCREHGFEVSSHEGLGSSEEIANVLDLSPELADELRALSPKHALLLSKLIASHVEFFNRDIPERLADLDTHSRNVIIRVADFLRRYPAMALEIEKAIDYAEILGMHPFPFVVEDRIERIELIDRPPSEDEDEEFGWRSAAPSSTCRSGDRVSPSDLRERVMQWIEENVIDGDTREMLWYTQQQWLDRGEKYGNDAPLTAVIDGTRLLHVLNYPESKRDFAIYDGFYEFVNTLGYLTELGHTWSLHFYPTVDGHRSRLEQRLLRRRG